MFHHEDTTYKSIHRKSLEMQRNNDTKMGRKGRGPKENWLRQIFREWKYLLLDDRLANFVRKYRDYWKFLDSALRRAVTRPFKTTSRSNFSHPRYGRTRSPSGTAACPAGEPVVSLQQHDLQLHRNNVEHKNLPNIFLNLHEVALPKSIDTFFERIFASRYISKNKRNTVEAH